MLYWLHLIWQWCGSLSTLCHLEGVCWMVHALPCPSLETDKPCWGSVCSKMRARTTSTVSVFNQWSKMPMIRLVCLLPLYLLVGFRHGPMVFLQHRALKAFQETLRSNSFLKPYAQWMPAAMNENPTPWIKLKDSGHQSFLNNTWNFKHVKWRKNPEHCNVMFNFVQWIPYSTAKEEFWCNRTPINSKHGACYISHGLVAR